MPVGLLVLAGRRFRSPADGLLIGVASGAGFAALETMGYAFVTLIESRGSLAALDDVLLLRGLLSPAAHMAWTGLTASALWLAAARGYSTGGLLRFLGAYVTAVLLHTAWDSLGSVTAYAVLAVLSLGLLMLATHRLAIASRRRQVAPAMS